MSVVQEHFIAGVQQFLPEFMSMYGQTVNSYSRLVPGYWRRWTPPGAWKTAPRPCA